MEVRAEADGNAGLYETLTYRRLSEVTGLSSLGMNLGGWLSAGVTYNNHNPQNHSNGPVTFNDRASEVQLNQLNLFVERIVNKEARHWDFGGRIDFMWGTDSRFTQAAGHWDSDLIDRRDLRFYEIAVPQAYLEVVTPWFRGTTVKLGHFYTILGQEVVQAPNNFFYSHSYCMQYGEPFTHTGVLISYPVNDQLTVQSGAVTGPYRGGDNFDKNLGTWNFLGGLTWVSESAKTSLSASLTAGDAEPYSPSNRTIVSLVLNHALAEDLHYIIQFDYGSQAMERASEANWYGINQYLLYTVTETVSVGMRGEWFRDNSGFRVTAIPASYYELTAGVNWKPESWLLLRLEGRNDWADAKGMVIQSGRRNDQFTLGANVTVMF